MLKKYIYANGRIIKSDQPAIFVNDIGFLRGYGVFDFMRTYNGKIFHFADHYRRFVNSAQTLDLIVKFNTSALEALIYRLIKKNNLVDASIRLILTGGPAIDGLNFKPNNSNLTILIEEIYQLPPSLFKNGAKLITFDYQRLLPSAKNLNYIWAVKLQKEKKKKKAIEILYVNNSFIFECSTSNFFIIKNRRLITPRADILLGVTRQVVINLAKNVLTDEKLIIEERPIKINELKTAEEAFITATNKNILPIVKIDDQVIGSGQVGPRTKKLMKLFSEYTNNY